MVNIRQIGDKKLHHPPQKVDWSNQALVDSLPTYIAQMKKDLIETGGAGIAANQCGSLDTPLQIIIIGTSNKEARKRAQERYPDREIPYETVMINPNIIQLSGNTYYPTYGEGCLSVRGALRARIKRYTQATIEYDDESGNRKHETYHDFFAHIIQHECDHLKGIIYLQKLFDDLSPEQLTTILNCVNKVIKIPQRTECDHFSVPPVLIFKREGDEVIFDQQDLTETLKLLGTETLKGITTILHDLTKT